MDTAIRQQIQVPMEALALATRGIRGCLLATADGVSIMHHDLEQQNEALAALSASSLGIGRSVTEVGDCGQLEELCFKGVDGWISVVAVGNRAVLTTVAHEGCNIGMVLYYTRKYADEILEILDPEQAREREEASYEQEDDHGSMKVALRALAALDKPQPVEETVEPL